MRLLSFFVLLFWAGEIGISCSNRNPMEQVALKWQGKTIEFPSSWKLQHSKYRIVSYVDTTGCTNCKLHLFDWNVFKQELDSLTSASTVSFLFVVHPDNRERIKYLLKQNNFGLPVYLDTNHVVNGANRFPADHKLQTFLLDSNNRVILIGNPVVYPKIKELYRKVITGDLLPEKEMPLTKVEYTASSVDLGEFPVKESREAVFLLKNIGEHPLIVRDVVTSCGCAKPRFDRSPVKPGNTWNVAVEMQPEEEGYFEKTVRVYGNAGPAPIEFKIKGRAMK